MNRIISQVATNFDSFYLKPDFNESNFTYKRLNLNYYFMLTPSLYRSMCHIFASNSLYFLSTKTTEPSGNHTKVKEN